VPSRRRAVPEIRLRGVEIPFEGLAGLSLPRSSSVEDRVLCGRSLRTPPGPEGSNGKEILLGAAGAPGWSWLAEVSQVREFDEGGTTISLWNSNLLLGIPMRVGSTCRRGPSGDY